MELEHLRQELSIDDEELAFCAGLAGIGLTEELSYEQEELLWLAALLRQNGFSDESIRVVCADPALFPGVLRREMADAARRGEVPALLEHMQELAAEDWTGSDEDVEILVEAMRYGLPGSAAGIWGPFNWFPMIVCFLVALLLALALRPVLQRFVLELWSRISG